MTLPTTAGIYASHPSTRFRIGDVVSINWNCAGRVTCHRIVAKQMNAPGCQTGTLFEVVPPVAKGAKWIDAAWTFKDGLEVL
jgi:hypothetical protein